MKQFCTDNKTIALEVLSGHLLFVDPLYFSRIVENYELIKDFNSADKRLFLKTIEEKVFPYGGGGLLGYKIVDEKSKTYSLNLSELKKYDSAEDLQEELVTSKQITAFGLDTSSFLIIDLLNFDTLIRLINYDELIDALISEQLDKYIDKVNDKLNNKGWAYVVSSGDSGDNEFDGDGSYILD